MSTILVADDEAAVCSVIRLVLCRAGHEVVCCADGEAARDLLASRDFDAALIDLGLPKIHGLKVIQSARASNPTLPIVVMSGMMLEPGDDLGDGDGPAMAIEGLHRLAKPFKPKDLTSLVTRITAGRADHTGGPELRVAGGGPL
jgi:DNA-binding response OmpR family regulator